MAEDTTARRKDSHLDICVNDAGVEPLENSTLFEQVSLVHSALPELSWDEIDLSTPFFGKTLKLPLLITGMTGGTERASQVNRELAALAEEAGIAFGVGSQRVMLEDLTRSSTFAVRQVAPNAVLLGNIGLGQLLRLPVSDVLRLRDAIGADGLAVHLNAAQELTQPEGDRDFRGGYRALEALASALGDRLVVKETGCGISPEVARRLVGLGVRHLDVSGLGGTSWVRVEQLRSSEASRYRTVGGTFSGWGIPTAAAVASVRRALSDTPQTVLIASGGIRHGLDVAKSIALGANLAGMALPFLRAQSEGGLAAARRVLDTLAAELRQAYLLTGSRNAAELRRTPLFMAGELNRWVEALGTSSRSGHA